MKSVFFILKILITCLISIINTTHADILHAFSLQTDYGNILVLGENHNRQSILDFQKMIKAPESYRYLLELPADTKLEFVDYLASSLLLVNIFKKYPHQSVLVDCGIQQGPLDLSFPLDTLFDSLHPGPHQDPKKFMEFFEKLGDIPPDSLECLPDVTQSTLQLLCVYRELFMSNQQDAITKLSTLVALQGFATFSLALRHMPNALAIRDKKIFESICTCQHPNVICLIGDDHLILLHQKLEAVFHEKVGPIT